MDWKIETELSRGEVLGLEKILRGRKGRKNRRYGFYGGCWGVNIMGRRGNSDGFYGGGWEVNIKGRRGNGDMVSMGEGGGKYYGEKRK